MKEGKKMNQVMLSTNELLTKMKTLRSLFEEDEKISLKTLAKKDIPYGVTYIYDPYYHELIQQVGFLFIHTEDEIRIYYLFCDNYQQLNPEQLYIHSTCVKTNFDLTWMNTLKLEQELDQEWLTHNALFTKTKEMEHETKRTLSYLQNYIN